PCTSVCQTSTFCASGHGTFTPWSKWRASSFLRSMMPCIGMATRTSAPRRRSARGSEPATSPRPPTLASGAISTEAKSVGWAMFDVGVRELDAGVGRSVTEGRVATGRRGIRDRSDRGLTKRAGTWARPYASSVPSSLVRHHQAVDAGDAFERGDLALMRRRVPGEDVPEDGAHGHRWRELQVDDAVKVGVAGRR